LGVANQLLVKIRGGITAEDDRDVRSVFFAEARNFQGTLNMGKPVEVYAKGPGMESGNELSHVKILILNHPQGQIDDADRDSVPLQMLRDGGEAYRIHLENGRGRHEVANGPEEDGKLAKIID
jgi:hypothetical protein